MDNSSLSAANLNTGKSGSGFIERIRIFKNNTDWLGQIVGGRVRAGFYLVFLKMFRNVAVSGHVGDLKFFFRYCDYSSLREILVMKEYDFLKDEVASRKIKTVIDCGGHIGLPVLSLLQYNPALNVISVEASADNYKILQKNKDLSGADWTVLNRACWKNEDTLSFSHSSDSMSNHVSDTGKDSVQGISLATLCETFGTEMIDLVKVDIEGAEEAFICSNPSALSKIGRMVIELHPRYCNIAAVEAVLDQNFPNKRVISGRNSKNPVIYYFR